MRQRNLFHLPKIKGVDFTSPLLSVEDARAIEMSNLLTKEFGRLQKRKPWEQITPSLEFSYYKTINGVLNKVDNPINLNALFSFVAEDGKEHVVAHIGKCLFEVTGLGREKDFKEIIFTPLCNSDKTDVIELVNEKTKAVTSGNRLYIMGGTKYLMVRFYEENNLNKWDLVVVEDSKYVYIPTTSIGITYADSPVAGRSQLDDVNLLSSLRKNKLISGTLFKGNNVIRTTRFYEYELDGDIDTEDEFDDSFSIKLEYRKAVN